MTSANPRWALLPDSRYESWESYLESNANTPEFSCNTPESIEPPPGRWFTISDSMLVIFLVF